MFKAIRKEQIPHNPSQFTMLLFDIWFNVFLRPQQFFEPVCDTEDRAGAKSRKI